MTLPAQDAAPPRVRPVWLDRRTPPHVATLVMLSGVPALNMNMMVPSLPSIAADLGAEYGVAALAISAYLALTAVLQIAIGPLSDRYGRRPIILVAFAVFLVATVGCILAPSIEALLAFRMLQSAIAAGIVLSRAIVRDMVPMDQAASMIGYVTMGMSVAPMIGPMAGGFLDEVFGWRAIFMATFVFGLLGAILAWADLGETNSAPSASFGAQMRAYPALARSQRFWGYSGTATFASGSFFAFLGGGPWVATEVLGMEPAELGLYFGLIALGYMLGNFLSGRYAGRMGLNRMMLIGGCVSALGPLLAGTFLLAGALAPATFFGSCFFVGLGNGLTLPSANAGIVSVRPELAGSASGLSGALMIGGGAALAAVTGALLGPGSQGGPLICMMLASALLGLATTLWVIAVARRRGPLGAG